MLKTIQQTTQVLNTITAPATGVAVALDRVKLFSAQVNLIVNTNAAGTFAAASLASNHVTITTHGYTTGLIGQLTSAGSLPTGLSLSTNYYIIVVDANTVKFASTLANAQAGTAITLSGGSGNSTFTPTALATATVGLQKSNDGVSWSAEGSTQSVTASGTFWLESKDPTGEYLQVAYSLASGSFSASTIVKTKGHMN